MKKIIVFDTGPIISLATNNLLWILEPLKKEFDGEFLIPECVKKELIDRPLKGKRFKFEAMQVLSLMNRGILKLVEDPEVKAESKRLLDLANRIFKAKGNWMQLVHEAEIQAVALDKITDAAAFVVDERTMRMLIEYPEKLRKIMEHKLHLNIEIDKKNLAEFKKSTRDIDMIRSTELVTIAFEKGLLDKYLPNLPNPRKELLESVLWGVKLNGCSISEMEINKILKIEAKK
jgi:predicted nucleic acid-binding protein